MTFRLRQSSPADGERIVDIWRSAVDATHDFLSKDDREAIEKEVQTFLPHAPLWIVTDKGGKAIGFMSLSPGQIDALFIDALHRGRGAGRMLVEHAISLGSALQVDVNEQNFQAIGFYERLGFTKFGRSPTDEQGRLYPLLHMVRGS